MKKSKFTKVISFLLAIALVLSSAVVVLAASTYSTKETTYDCPRTLCSKNLMISGPYGDPNETVDSNIPYLGGKTYQNIMDNHYPTNNDFHMYIIYCPKYNYSDSNYFRDTMTLMFAMHGYSIKGYTQLNASQHYVNKKCDHGTDFKGTNVYALTQGLCGQNSGMDDSTLVEMADKYQAQSGCGKETSVIESHTWSYGAWESNGSSYHTRTKTCVYCGYSARESVNHSTQTGSWTNSSDTQHKRTISCSTCGYSTNEYANHQFTYGAWQSGSNSQHKRTATCSTCGYSKTEYSNHNLITSQPLIYGTEDVNDSTYPHSDYHKYKITCSDCNYTDLKYEPHEMFVEVDWYDYDSIDHKKITHCSICEFGVSYYYPHNYPLKLFTYEAINDAEHQVIRHCDTCDRTEIYGTVNHNFVAGEWYEYSSNNPYDDEYNHTKYHQRESVCSDCGNIKIEHGEHEWYWVTESWNYSNEERHTRTKRCKQCDMGWGYTDYHHYKTAPYYNLLNQSEHIKINPCDECVYEKETLEAHSFTASTVYTQFSESQHKVTQSCICGEKYISYADHVDQNSDCYCDKCGYLMTKFSVTVPTTMVLTMGTDGEVYAPSDVVIINNSTAAVSVKKADINSRNGWNIVPYSTNMANEKVDSKKIGFKMNGIQTDSAGTTDSLSYNNSWIIEKDTSSSVVYDAVVSATSSPIDEQVIEIVYIVDWKE